MDSLGNQLDSGQVRRWPYLLHVLCLGWIALVVGVGLVRHRSVEELWERWRVGESEEQLETLQALVQRADPAQLAAEFPDALFAENDPLLRELAFTNLFTRRPATRPGPRRLDAIVDPAERFRALCWLQNQTTTPRRFTWEDLDQWFSEGAGR